MEGTRGESNVNKGFDSLVEVHVVPYLENTIKILVFIIKLSYATCTCSVFLPLMLPRGGWRLGVGGRT